MIRDQLNDLNKLNELNIRETEGAKHEPSSPRRISVWWLWCFAALAIAGTLAASLHGRELGWPAFVLLIGISIVSILAILTIFFNRQATLGDVILSDKENANLYASFEKQKTPSLIVKAGKPEIANQAYYTLAQELGLVVEDGAPPPVERLFSNKEKTASAAIYRLHHTNNDNEISEEVVSVLDASQNYRSFLVRVNSLKDGQLWQIEDADLQTIEDTPTLTEAPIGLFSARTDGAILKTNAVLKGWLGFDAQTEPMHISEFIENPGALLDSEKSVGRSVRCDTRLMTQKGVVSPVVMVGSWHALDSGDIYASVAVYGHSGLRSGSASVRTPINATLDIKAPNAMGEDNAHTNNSDLKTERRRFGAGVSNAPFGVVRLDSTDLNAAKVRDANRAMQNLCGELLVDLSGENSPSFKSLFVDSPEFAAFIAGGINVQDGPIDVRLKPTAKGTIQAQGANNSDTMEDFTKTGCPVDVHFGPPDKDGCTAYIVDISSRKALENQLGHSQKMQAIGQLAAGLAHEFNNLLAAIRLNTDVLLERHPIGDPSYPELQKINQTVSRSSGLVRKLLAFSRRQTLRALVLDVTETLTDVTHLLQDVLVEKVKLEVIHGRGLLPILADKGQLDTVLLNLCVNARDAMLEKGGGTIVLQSLKVTDEELAALNIPLRSTGTYVRFDVTDTGTGMDKETQDKIFEPFFTTKEQGKGTGLGLATVYGIVQQSNGHLRVSSEIGKGTTFSVFIPTATGDVQLAPKAKPVAARIRPTDLAGEGRILFVEDEPNVRVVAAKTLRKRGYTVIEAENGEEAYEILKSEEEPFDLMLSDVVMPGMDGPTLLKTARPILGDAKIVFISGYAEEEFSELLAEEPDVTFLPKPFSLVKLAEKVKSVLGDDES